MQAGRVNVLTMCCVSEVTVSEVQSQYIRNFVYYNIFYHFSLNDITFYADMHTWRVNFLAMSCVRDRAALTEGDQLMSSPPF